MYTYYGFRTEICHFQFLKAMPRISPLKPFNISLKGNKSLFPNFQTICISKP